jgi:hypothetical protein
MPAKAAEAALDDLSAIADVPLAAGDIFLLPEARLLGLRLGTADTALPLLATVLGLAAVPLGLPAAAVAASSAALTASILLPSMLLLPKALGYSIVFKLML